MLQSSGATKQLRTNALVGVLPIRGNHTCCPLCLYLNIRMALLLDWSADVTVTSVLPELKKVQLDEFFAQWF